MIWLLGIAAVSAIARGIWILLNLGKGLTLEKHARVLAIAGSGGHTTELLRLMTVLSASKYHPRCYVVANTDKMSTTKINHFETQKAGIMEKDYFIFNIPRSREVAQPWMSSLLTTVIATLSSFPIVWISSPDVILCNGPGTCIPLCMVGLLYKFLGIRNIQIIFVESVCRVESLSLSGLILYHLADKMFVQWPKLQEKYPKASYLGRIV